MQHCPIPIFAYIVLLAPFPQLAQMFYVGHSVMLKGALYCVVQLVVYAMIPNTPPR